MSIDDKLYCMLSGCSGNGIKLSRLVLYMYLCQVAGFNCGYTYKVTTSGVGSCGVVAYVNSLVDLGLLKYEDRLVVTTEEGLKKVDGWGSLKGERLLEYLENQSTETLSFIVMVNIVMNEACQDKGCNWMVKNRSQIESTLIGLVNEFSPVRFNWALGFLKNIQKGDI